MDYISLFQFQKKIAGTLQENFSSQYWVVAEISDFKVGSSGHCYMELVEKRDNSSMPVAKVRAVIWSSRYVALSSYFKKSTSRDLANGMKVLVAIELSYHPLYGLSFVINNIDPTYTLGDIEKYRQEVIAQLKDDGVFDMNRELEFDLVVNKIAVVSSSKAAGYQDFMKEIGDNPYKYRYDIDLFEAVMQGDGAVDSIISALDSVYSCSEEGRDYEVVVIIRGGGATSDLSCFDSYDLASVVAQFPIPVVSGIGHDKDVSVVDLVSNTTCKTPTAVAQFFKGLAREFDVRLDRATRDLKNISFNLLSECNSQVMGYGREFESIYRKAIYQTNERLVKYHTFLRVGSERILMQERLRLENSSSSILSKSSSVLANKSVELNKYRDLLQLLPKQIIQNNKSGLLLLESQINQFDPVRIFDMGYSVVSFGGSGKKSLAELKEGDEITITNKKNKLSANINNIKLRGGL